MKFGRVGVDRVGLAEGSESLKVLFCGGGSGLVESGGGRRGRTSPDGDFEREEPGLDVLPCGLLERSKELERLVEGSLGLEELVAKGVDIDDGSRGFLLLDLFVGGCERTDVSRKLRREERERNARFLPLSFATSSAALSAFSFATLASMTAFCSATASATPFVKVGAATDVGSSCIRR